MNKGHEIWWDGVHIWDEITVSLRVENLQIQSSKKGGGSIYVGLIEVIKEFSKGFLCMYRLLYGYKDTVGAYVWM